VPSPLRISRCLNFQVSVSPHCGPRTDADGGATAPVIHRRPSVKLSMGTLSYTSGQEHPGRQGDTGTQRDPPIGDGGHPRPGPRTSGRPGSNTILRPDGQRRREPIKMGSEGTDFPSSLPGLAAGEYRAAP